MNRKIITISFLLISLLCVPTLCFAEGFAAHQYLQLEKEVRASHTLEFIAKKLSETNDYLKWPDQVSTELKLYVAANWFGKQMISETAGLLENIKPGTTYYDLWVYYRAMVAMYQSKMSVAGTYLSYLEKNYATDIEYMMLKSIFLSQNEDLIGAIQIMDKILQKHRRYGEGYLQRGFYHMLAYSNDLAIRDFTRAIKYLPQQEIYKRQQAYFQNGLLYIKYKFKEEKGMTLIKQGVSLDPSSNLVKEVQEALRQR